MTGSGGSGPSRPDEKGWLDQPLTPTAPPQVYPDGTVPPRRAVAWRAPGHGKRHWALMAVAAVAVLGVAAALNTSRTDRATAPAPDLQGFHHVDDLCAITDTAPYLSAGLKLTPTAAAGPKYPLHQTQLHPAVDTMECTIRFSTAGALDRAADSTVRARAVVHKKSDPGPEFTARFETWTQSPLLAHDEITAVRGLGEEAYLVRRKDDRDARPHTISLAVRHGWTTYEISWSRLSSLPATSTAKPPTAEAAIALLRRTAATTLRVLRA